MMDAEERAKWNKRRERLAERRSGANTMVAFCAAVLGGYMLADYAHRGKKIRQQESEIEYLKSEAEE